MVALDATIHAFLPRHCERSEAIQPAFLTDNNNQPG
jgi:hypothetical protein